MDQSIHRRTVNLGMNLHEVLHHLTTVPVYIHTRQCAYDAVYDELRAHDQVALFPASFTFMIKARTKMDKACNGAKIKAAWRRSESPMYYGKEKVWALNMLDYVCSARWRGAPRLFASNVYVACLSSIHFSSASALSDLERSICLPDCTRVDIIVSHYSRGTSLDIAQRGCKAPGETI